MSRTWLILDSNYLCYRAFYTTGTLSYGDVMTGVVFGFLREIKTLQDLHMTRDIVFAFDFGEPLRKQFYQRYKANRKKEVDEASRLLISEFKKQVRLLRTEYLQELGFSNVLYQHGYEADDVIAAVVKSLPRGDKAIIVSADHDLYQLLGPHVVMWHPQKKETMTEEILREKHGVGPIEWIDVKCLAGCDTDGILGVPGVGESTACKFLAGRLKPHTKAYQAITESNIIWERNRKLIMLPYPGMEPMKLHPDNVTAEKWSVLTGRLGMESIRNYF